MKKIGIALFILALIGWMLKDTFTQSGIEDLKGGFKEVTSYRNENNTGPVQRIYAVTLTDTLAAQLKEYGDLMPHNKYGNTKVYYFLAGKEVPSSLSPGDINFDLRFNKNCFALYEKSAMGNVGMIKWPLK
ncbi:hypothetical protein [Pedobacter xixiisoli]|uniref:Uncharacterized protein n=1 Tax=Pedobacter xixiisoli TaxID=1476464 RepID=A0A285ZNQ5_9SPHI|nr:hypothetical protein [Pedobacter xixiisoli]SOD11257.1 hypothetical protein SAMN06297358_0059 [Pedobacter xixiisoli]